MHSQFYSARSFATLGSFMLAVFMTLTQPLAAQSNKITFKLFPHPKFLACIQGSNGAPSAEVTITRGSLNDTLIIEGKNFKPGLSFDMFTVQRTPLLPGGTLDSNFTTFGLAWYQSDLHANAEGEFKTGLRTIFLDQIFGFDPDVSLTPLNTFHLGFWFNDPKKAQACGFDITKPTPFNGEHNAGPVAMISVPDANTNLGPLCTNPGDNGTCNP